MSEAAIIVGIEPCQFVPMAGKWVITRHKRPGEMWRYFLSESGMWMVSFDMRAEFDSEQAAREFAKKVATGCWRD